MDDLSKWGHDVFKTAICGAKTMFPPVKLDFCCLLKIILIMTEFKFAKLKHPLTGLVSKYCSIYEVNSIWDVLFQGEEWSEASTSANWVLESLCCKLSRRVEAEKTAAQLIKASLEVDAVGWGTPASFISALTSVEAPIWSSNIWVKTTFNEKENLWKVPHMVINVRFTCEKRRERPGRWTQSVGASIHCAKVWQLSLLLVSAACSVWSESGVVHLCFIWATSSLGAISMQVPSKIRKSHEHRQRHRVSSPSSSAAKDDGTKSAIGIFVCLFLHKKPKLNQRDFPVNQD